MPLFVSFYDIQLQFHETLEKYMHFNMLKWLLKQSLKPMWTFNIVYLYCRILIIYNIDNFIKY